MSGNKNISWINIGRTLCMFFIFLHHCNAYYNNIESPVFLFYLPFYTSFFFFISGYLFFRDIKEFSFKKRIKNLINKLLWPLLIYSSCILYIKTTFIYGTDLDIQTFIKIIFGGTASWFISALIVAQILLLVLIYFFRNKFSYLLLISFLFVLTAFYLKNIDPTPFPYYYKTGMIAVFFMVLGGICNVYNRIVSRFINKKVLLFCGITYIAVILFDFYGPEYYQDLSTVSYDNIPFGLFTNLLGIFFMYQLCHSFSNLTWLEYIGKNSIVFYFFAGGIPLLFCRFCLLYFPEGGHINTLIITIISLLMVYPITFIVNKYFSWTLDFSKIINLFHKQNKR